MKYKKVSKSENRLRALEWFFYGWAFFTTLSPALGFDVPLLGSIWISVLALFAIAFRKWGRRNNDALLLIWATAASYTIIQVYVYEISPQTNAVKVFMVWAVAALVLDTLMEKPQFFKRLTLVMFLISLFTVPLMQSQVSSLGGATVYSVRVEGTSLANPNELGAWAAFTTIALWLFSNTQMRLRTHWIFRGCSALSFLVMIATISRGAMVSFILSFLVAIKKLIWWKKLVVAGTLTIMFFLAGETSFIQNVISSFETRSFRDTGRLQVWPLAIRAIFDSPGLGYGSDHVWVPISPTMAITPHNCFIFLWLSSGILPVIPFIILWVKSLRQAILKSKSTEANEIDVLPLVICAFLLIQTSDGFFVNVWCTAALSLSLLKRSQPAAVYPMAPRYGYVKEMGGYGQSNELTDKGKPRLANGSVK